MRQYVAGGVQHGQRFVGGHPMTGTSQSGWAATDPTLFHGAAWAVGVDAGTHPK
ncbi:prephenate dehydrogenase/arogenate dehydrogenase family protein, partial [Nocardia cyriacigeorgica]|nr:prephenate dehydrogenase/arogenate dehydrogenase family protein [Nocardia cyriacigeorgica]